jgi:hypothetical protein
MGRSAGAGHPLTLRCARCKVGRDWRAHEAKGINLEATGHVRPGRKPRGPMRSLGYAVQYRCRDCGHVGWSQHTDAERLLKQKEARDALRTVAGRR